MDIKLADMSIGDILGRGMALLFKRLPYFYVIQLLVLLPNLALQLTSPYAPPGMALLIVFVSIVVGPIGSAAMLRIIVQEYLDGQVSLGEAFVFALSRFLPLFLTSLLMGFLIFLGMLACCIPGIYLAVIWSLMSQVVVVEYLSGMEALNRSKDLVAGHFGQVFGMLLLLGLILFGATIILQFALAAALPFQEVVLMARPPGAAPNPFLVQPRIVSYRNFALVHIISTVVMTAIQAYLPVCTTLLYFSLRGRKEGYDMGVEFRNIAAWRKRFESWDDEGPIGGPPVGSAAPQTGIKEPGTALPPPHEPPETGIKGSDSPPQ